MDLFNLLSADLIKTEIELNESICRCCLSRDKPMKNVVQYTNYFKDFIGLEVSPSDNLPQSMCLECVAILMKSVKFKHKVLRANAVLTDHVARCAPFSYDVNDMELSKHATPILAATETLAFDTYCRTKDGFHKVLEHCKCIKKVELSLESELADPVCKVEDEGLKEESGFSDYEDNLPLDEFKSQSTKSKNKINGSTDGEVDKPKRKKGTKLKRKLEKNDSENYDVDETSDSESRKKRKSKQRKETTIEPKSSVRKAVEIDPTKIRIIELNPEEQIKMREEESKNGYCKFPFKCMYCFKGFNYEQKLTNHMKRHSPTRGNHYCKLCHTFLPTVYSYKMHTLTHTTRYECMKCGRRMLDRSSILDHYNSVHEGIVTPYTCHVCGKISNNNKTHRGHMRNHHAGDRPKCSHCGKTFVNMDSLNEHILIHMGVKNHPCPECGKKFRTRTQAKNHERIHSDRKDFYCVECDVRFKTAVNLRQHLKKSSKHNDKSTFKYPCGRCPRRLDSLAALQHHETFQHDGVRLHVCVQCGAALATHNSLAKHLRTHQGYRPPLKHVCHLCGKAFRGKNVLTNHVRTHTGEKPFECEHCGRKFSQRTAMKTHINLVHLRLKRGTKVKDETISVVAKEEGVFENWTREEPNTDNIYFAVAAP